VPFLIDGGSEETFLPADHCRGVGEAMRPLPSRRVIHLCLDMQVMFGRDGPWPTPWMERVLPKVAALTGRMPAHTIFTRFIPPMRATDMPGMWREFYRKWSKVTRQRLPPECLELLPPLRRFAPPAVVFDKFVYSAFADGRLASHLAAHSASTLLISGAETDVCVLATVLAAVDHGYRVVLVTDAICSSSDEGHDALMRMYTNRFDIQIELASTEEALAALEG
jgi:nicotinamidase-related amidase